MKRRLARFMPVLVAALVAAANAAAAPARAAVTGAAGSPAEWRSFDLIVDFSDLPRLEVQALSPRSSGPHS